MTNSIKAVLTEQQIEDAQAEAFRELSAKGYNGGMGGKQWDLASARAIERATLAAIITRRHSVKQVRTWANDYRKEGGWALVVEMLDSYADILASASAHNAQPVTDSTTEWRCFHCDDVFHDKESAALHFGSSQQQEPICVIDVARLRQTEELISRYQNEDTDLHREIYGLLSAHSIALRREEEKGYERGLRDAGYASPIDLTAVIAWLENGCDPKHAATELRIYQKHNSDALVSGTAKPAIPQVDVSAEQIDHHLDSVLRASGSALKYFSMKKTLDDMRAAVKEFVMLVKSK